MTQSMVGDIMRDALTTVLLTAGPVLMAALLVGLIVSIFQATTQIQEQTLTFVPKIVAVFFTIMITGPYMLSKLTDFTTQMFTNIATMIR
ncbi:MAG: flagellar biosynthesis protein FliQ [Peptostreptococcaceae bacterium]|nr:flagellar biosynthesis protein FliQ [Peptostreptococcaceae bacterium]